MVEFIKEHIVHRFSIAKSNHNGLGHNIHGRWGKGLWRRLQDLNANIHTLFHLGEWLGRGGK